MNRQKWTIGSIVKIPLSNKKHCYGQLLHHNSIAIFELQTEEDLLVSEITKKEIIFIVAIYTSIISSGHWRKVDKGIIKYELKTLPLQFIEDELNSKCYEIYDPNTGEIKSATKNQCIGLERAAVWEAEHVESRIEDYFAGNKNFWVEQLSLK